VEKRKGATSRAAVSANVLEQLNAGTLESATLSEGLAIDFGALLKVAAPELDRSVLKRVVATDGVTRRMAIIGQILAEQYGVENFARFATHPSDTVRGWAAYQLAAVRSISLAERTDLVRTLADDPHFGVREWAWLAMRDHIASELDAAIVLLTPWTMHASANIRRFATESTRPRGVWCAHISRLKTDPAIGLPLLEPLRSDASKYVRDSVGNWLNDAAKTQPEWVKQLCARCQKTARLQRQPTPLSERAGHSDCASRRCE
jgi:3-methyladenine DNA glycosylase AlkC